MASKLTASFILKLEDQLSGPLAKIEKQLAILGVLGKKLNLSGLETGTKLLEEGAAAARKMSDGMSAIERAAGRAGAALARMASQAGHQLKTASEKIGVIGGAVAGISVIEPVRKAAEIDNTLRHQAIYGGKTGPAIDIEVKRLNRSDADLAMATARPLHEIAEGGLYLQQSQMASETVEKLLHLSAEAATAYNSDTLSVAKTAFALHENLGISEKQIGLGLGIIGTASKLQHFQFNDYAQLFPEVATLAAAKGVHGIEGATDLASMLVISRGGAATPGQAATNLGDFASSLSHKNTSKKFKEYGVDLEKLLGNARKAGINPLEAVLAKVQAIQSANPGKDIVGHLFQNHQAQQFVNQFLSHVDDYLKAKKHIKERASFETLGEDFKKAITGIAPEMKTFDVILEIIITRIGYGFAPVLRIASQAIYGIEQGFQHLDQRVPGLSEKLIAGAAAFLLMGSAIGILGVVLPAIGAGLALIFSPIGWIVLAIAAVGFAIYEIVENWGVVEAFLLKSWHSLRDGWNNFADPIKRWASDEITSVVAGVQQVFGGLELFFAKSWASLRDGFMGFGLAIKAWAISEWQAVVDAIERPFIALESRFRNSFIGRHLGLAPSGGDGTAATGSSDSPAIGQPGSGNSTLTIELAPELRASSTPASAGPFDFSLASRPSLGPTLVRP